MPAFTAMGIPGPFLTTWLARARTPSIRSNRRLRGDVELDYDRRQYGKQFVLFGNLEIADIENMPDPPVRREGQACPRSWNGR